MAKETIIAPEFDEIVFKNRNKLYGAYRLRKRYNRVLLVSMLTGIAIVSAVILYPFLKATTQKQFEQREEREVIAVMEELDQPEELDVEAPPPPPPTETTQQLKYVAPEVVDSISPEEEVDLLTATEAMDIIQDEEVVEIIEPEEEVVEEFEPPQDVLVLVEEMPRFPGGEEALYDYIYSNIEYPVIALENEISGTVIVRFCVTYQGDVNQATVLRGVDTSLDEEALRVVNTLPKWRPGKQAGKPVNVWYIVRIQFRMQEE